MYDLLSSAVQNEKNNDFTFFMQGDLMQMSTQRSFLNSHGVQTKQNNVYPCVRKCDVAQALGLIWQNKVAGWWHYMDNYIQYSVCTKEEFLAYLNRI